MFCSDSIRVYDEVISIFPDALPCGGDRGYTFSFFINHTPTTSGSLTAGKWGFHSCSIEYGKNFDSISKIYYQIELKLG